MLLRVFTYIATALAAVDTLDLSQTEIIATLPENGELHKILQVSWGYNATHIEMQLEYPTLGWMALGLSPSGGMDQSDVLFGYVNDSSQEVVIQVSKIQCCLYRMGYLRSSSC